MAGERADPLLVPQDGQCAGQGAGCAAGNGQAVAAGHSGCAGSRDGPGACGGVHQGVSNEPAQRGGVPRGRPGGEPEPPKAADAASEVDPEHEPGGAGLRGGAAAKQSDPEVPQREGVFEAGVRHAVAGQRALAEGEVHGDGTSPA